MSQGVRNRREWAGYRGSYLSYLLMYAFYFGSLALLSGLLSVYLMDRGYSAGQVSFVVSCSLVASMILQPIIGHLNDYLPVRSVTGAALAASAVAGVLILFAQNVWSIALLYSLALSLLNGVNPVIETSATHSRYPYRYIRIWGTVGYAVCFQCGGVIYQHISPQSMYLFFGLSMLLCIVGLLGAERGGAPAGRPAAGQPRKNSQTEKARLLSRPFLLYLLIACLFYGITSLSTTYLPAMFQMEGVPVDLVSTIIFMITLSELPLIFFSHKFMDRFSNTQLLVGVFVLLIAQYGGYSLVPIPAVQIALAVLTKATATMTFIMLNLKVVASLVGSDQQMTALALVATCKNFASIAFQTLGGALLTHRSYSFLYFMLLLASCLGLLVCLCSRLPAGKQVKLFSN